MPKRVLVVDDDPQVRDVMKRFLEANGFTVKLTEDGDEAVRLLQRRDHPRIMLLDLDMPRLNGLEVLRRIMAHGIDVDVLVLSGHFDRNAFDLAIRLGAKGSLHKPVDFDDLLALLEQRIETRASSDG